MPSGKVGVGAMGASGNSRTDKPITPSNIAAATITNNTMLNFVFDEFIDPPSA
jgi:hypothetical protein